MKKLRQGLSVGRTLYIQEGPEPAKTDLIVGLVDTPADAARIVTAVNAVARIRALHAPEQRGPASEAYCRTCGTMAPCTTMRTLEDQ